MIRSIFVLMMFISLAANAQTQEWKLDQGHSSINFTIDHLVISEITGKFDSFSMDVKADKVDFSDAIWTVQIEAGSINTDNAKRDEHLKGSDFFNVTKNPTIKFVSSKFEKQKSGQYKLYGNLTMNGVTKPIVLDAKLNGVIKDPWGGTRAGLKVSGKLDRYEYGLKYNSALDNGGLAIGQEVRLIGNVELTKVEK